MREREAAPTGAHNEKPQATGLVISIIPLWKGRTQQAVDLCLVSRAGKPSLTPVLVSLSSLPLYLLSLPASLQKGVRKIFSHLCSRIYHRNNNLAVTLSAHRSDFLFFLPSVKLFRRRLLFTLSLSSSDTNSICHAVEEPVK